MDILIKSRFIQFRIHQLASPAAREPGKMISPIFYGTDNSNFVGVM